MKTLWPTIALFLSCSITAFSQTPAPTSLPRPTPLEDNDVVKISTNLIQLDVTVTDSKGKPVSDLRPDEIDIYENGKKQDITNLSFTTNVQPVTPKAVQPVNKDLALLPPPVIRPENIKRTIALVVDDLTLSFSDTWATRDALKKFVKEQMQGGDLVAIVRTGGGIGSLQQFTADKRQLLAAIEKLQFNMLASTRSGAFNPIEPSAKEEIDGTKNQKGETRNLSKDIQSEREFENEINEVRESIFTSGTLGAVNYVIRGMKDLPGRKSIMFLSGGLSLISRNEQGRPRFSRILDSLQRLTDLANRASVVIYSIDVRGVTFDGVTAADNTSGLSDDALEGRVRDRRDAAIDSQEGLSYLAKQTGGLIYNQNNISNGIRKALDDQSYYLVAYEPDGDTFDPTKRRFNKIEVKVRRAGVKVRYRSGFFGISDEKAAETKAIGNQALYNALTSPFAVNDVSLRMNALFNKEPKIGGYLLSFLHIEAKNLTFVRGPEGKYNTTFDMVASTYGDNGQIQDGQRSTFTLNLSEEAYHKAQLNGLVYDFAFKVKKPGAYQMRIAIRDNATDRVGSANQFVEVPNLKNNRLALSGVLLENIGFADWQRLETMAPDEALRLVDPKADTAIRRFRPGSVLTYSAGVYNPRSNDVNKKSLTTQVNIFSDQNMVFEGKPFAKEYAEQDVAEGIVTKGTMRLGSILKPGNYTLQLIVTDNNASGGRKVAIQFVPFEIIP